MKEIVRVLMERDGMDKVVAIAEARAIKAEILSCIESGEGDPEELFMELCGLEPDYMLGLIL